MIKPYPPEKFWKLYKKIPQELKDALFENETDNDVYEVCERNDISEEYDQVITLVTNVLLGVLPLEEFEKNLNTELNLEKTQSKKIIQEIYRFVFYPLKASLEELYGTEILSKSAEKKSLKSEVSLPEKESTPPKKDTYKEPIE